MLVALGAYNHSGGTVHTVPAIAAGGTGRDGPGGVNYENKATYVQGTYESTHQWRLTAGLRYNF